MSYKAEKEGVIVDNWYMVNCIGWTSVIRLKICCVTQP